MFLRVARLFLLCAILMVLAQYSDAQSVKVNFDHDFDFSKVHHYEWRTHPIFEKNPELQDRYSTAIQLVMSDTNKRLMNKGYQPVNHKPDVYLTFFVTARDVIRTYTDTIGPTPIAYGWYPWYGAPAWTVTKTEQYMDGTLLMDMIDAQDTKLIWRASATDAIKDFRNRDKNVDAAVKKIVSKFPPKQK